MSSPRLWQLASLLALALTIVFPDAALAAHPWGLDFEEPASPVMEHIKGFHDLLLVIITVITLFVFGLLVYVIIRFNARANPTPSRFAHNTMIEIVWTVIPIIILIVIAVPSFKLLYYGYKNEKYEMTVKAVGHQWYWSYEYPDHGNYTFDSRAIWDGPQTTIEQAQNLIKESAPNWLIPTPEPLRLLEVDNRLVLPVETNIRVLATATDVIHAIALPRLAVKKDAMPGRINETWVRIDKEGIYYGQCSEICGTGHGYMPLVVEAVSKEKFAEWIKAKAPAPAAAAPGVKPANAAPAKKEEKH